MLCYLLAIDRKSCDLLNNNNLRQDINEIYNDSRIDKYIEYSIDLENNIFHIVEILYNKKEEISKEIMFKKIKFDFSNVNIAIFTMFGIFVKLWIMKYTNLEILDELVECCGVKTTDWYREKRTTSELSFKQKFNNKDLSLAVTGDKLLSLKEENIDILIHICPNYHVQYDCYQPYIEKN